MGPRDHMTCLQSHGPNAPEQDTAHVFNTFHHSYVFPNPTEDFRKHIDVTVI